MALLGSDATGVFTCFSLLGLWDGVEAGVSNRLGELSLPNRNLRLKERLNINVFQSVRVVNQKK